MARTKLTGKEAKVGAFGKFLSGPKGAMLAKGAKSLGIIAQAAFSVHNFQQRKRANQTTTQALAGTGGGLAGGLAGGAVGAKIGAIAGTFLMGPLIGTAIGGIIGGIGGSIIGAMGGEAMADAVTGVASPAGAPQQTAVSKQMSSNMALSTSAQLNQVSLLEEVRDYLRIITQQGNGVSKNATASTASALDQKIQLASAQRQTRGNPSPMPPFATTPLGQAIMG